MERTKTIKVSEEEYRKIQEARQALALKGFQNLPPAAQPHNPGDFAIGAIVAIGSLLLLNELLKD